MHRCGAGEELRAFAEQTGALVMTTAGARGAFPRGPPTVGGHGVPLGDSGAPRLRLILAVGTQLGETVTYLSPPGWAGSDSQKLIHLEVDPETVGVNRATDVALVGDAAKGLAALTSLLAERGAPRSPSEPAATYAAEFQDFRGRSSTPTRTSTGRRCTPADSRSRSPSGYPRTR
ncbi:MAG: hypothetical protein M5U19_08095 [Microthrixaceae bacterium]|nr:hypothetical protein [Microthrixaceae bacterium]